VMSIRVILTPLFGSAAAGKAMRGSLAIAQRHTAHLAALFVRIDARDAIPVIGEGVSPAVIDQLTRAAEAEMKRQRAVARQAFDSDCIAAGIALADVPGGAPAVSAGWREATGRRDQRVPALARTSDLVVFARAKDDESPDLSAVLEATLFGAGRPLLLLPTAPPATIGERVAIAWNGRGEAARAVAGALPFLDAARSVQVLTAPTSRTEADVALELIEYLAWRGIAAERRMVECGDEPVAHALLRTARENSADLLVMGGYGRTRLSELVLGGVTRDVLHDADLPVLMAH
jgi:nucleotide-binding universal stress UspA family protein